MMWVITKLKRAKVVTCPVGRVGTPVCEAGPTEDVGDGGGSEWMEVAVDVSE